jgi:hypothetical protein
MMTEKGSRSFYRMLKCTWTSIMRHTTTKIAFIFSFIMTGSAATWKAQFVNEAYNKPAPTNPNNRLGTYTTFRKELIKAFLMFDSVGNALDEL